jgi:hypothetical protein
MESKYNDSLKNWANPSKLEPFPNLFITLLHTTHTLNALLSNSIQFWSEFFTCEANVLALLQILGRFPGVNFQVVYTPISPNGRCKEEKICQTNFSPRGKEKVYTAKASARRRCYN